MEFEWDPSKSEKCFAERGFDFAYAIRAFFDSDRLVKRDRRYDYGEKRYQLLGKVQGRVFVIVYTPRDNAVCIISARKGNKREVRQYEEATRED
jgi:hypothetical protein